MLPSNKSCFLPIYRSKTLPNVAKTKSVIPDIREINSLVKDGFFSSTPANILFEKNTKILIPVSYANVETASPTKLALRYKGAQHDSL